MKDTGSARPDPSPDQPTGGARTAAACGGSAGPTPTATFPGMRALSAGPSHRTRSRCSITLRAAGLTSEPGAAGYLVIPKMVRPCDRFHPITPRTRKHSHQRPRKRQAPGRVRR